MDKSFIEYRNNIIKDFKNKCKECNTINSFTDEQLDIVVDNFSEHEECYKNKEELEKEYLEIYSTVIYGENESVAIECMNCNSVIIDDVSLSDEGEN